MLGEKRWNHAPTRQQLPLSKKADHKQPKTVNSIRTDFYRQVWPKTNDIGKRTRDYAFAPRSVFRFSAISDRCVGFLLSQTSGSSSVSWTPVGSSARRVNTFFKYAQGSTKLFLQLATSEAKTAARAPARRLPTNSQFFLLMAIGRIARSTRTSGYSWESYSNKPAHHAVSPIIVAILIQPAVPAADGANRYRWRRSTPMSPTKNQPRTSSIQ